MTIFKICSITSNFNNKFHIYWNSDSVTKLYHSFTKLETLLVGSSLSCGLETKLRFSINRRCWAATGLKDKEWKTIRGFILLLLQSFQALIFMSLQQISPAIGIRRGAPLSVYVLESPARTICIHKIPDECWEELAFIVLFRCVLHSDGNSSFFCKNLEIIW